MLITNTERDLRRRICFAAVGCGSIACLSLFLPSLSSADSEFSANAGFSRRYSLTGSVETSYDRYWSHGGGPTTDDFRQMLLLDHRGFVADPNIFSYDVSGTVAHDAGQGIVNSTLVGENVGVTLLHSLPESWKKNEIFIPHPFWLRFSHDASSTFESTNYGLSFMHSAEPKQRYVVIEKATKADAEGEDSDLYEEGPARTSKIVEKERPFPIPRTFFDYDHYGMKEPGSPSTTNDILSVRSSLTGKTYDYRFLFEKQNQSGPLEIKKTTFQLEPIYRFYDEGTRRRLDIRNFLRYEENIQGQSSQLNSNLSWSRPIGKDTLAFSSNVGYTGMTAGGQTLTNYNAAGSAGYTHKLSSRLTNSTQVTATYTKYTGVVNHDERLSDTVSADISQIFGGTGSAFVGNDTQGLEYGTSLFLFTKTKIQTSIGYSYSLSSALGPSTANLSQQTSTNNAPQPISTNLPQSAAKEKIALQSFSFRATGPLLYNLSFQANADVTLSEVHVDGGTTTKQSTDSLSANLLWRLPKTSMTFGGNYTQSKQVDTVASGTASTSLFSTLSRTLPNRILFNLYNSWTKSETKGVQNTESTSFETKPSLRWTRGLTTVDAEYSFTRSMGGGPAVTENRFFVRLVRKFAAFF